VLSTDSLYVRTLLAVAPPAGDLKCTSMLGSFGVEPTTMCPCNPPLSTPASAMTRTFELLLVQAVGASAHRPASSTGTTGPAPATAQ
jgi:hypothetical protein